MKKIIYFVLIVIFSNTFSLRSESIGLVLSGGGAKGYAHIGVLKVLDEYNIPVNIISGTSMGALIGALYSCGYSGEEIEKIVIKNNWKNYFSDKPKRKYLPVLEKHIQEHYLFNFKIINNDIKIIKEFSSGQQILRNTSYYTERRTLDADGDFDKLYIPIRISATDMVKGQPVVFSSGNLADAVRASLAYPVVLPPYKINNKILIDGFVFDNIPVAPLEKAADKIIISNVSADYDNKDMNYKNMLSVINRTLNIMSTVDYKKQLKNKKYVELNHALTSYSSFSFDKIKEIINIGEKTTRKNINKIKALTQGVQKKERYQPENKEYNVSKIVVKGLEKINRKYLNLEMDIKENEKLDIDKLDEVIEHLYSLNLFKKVKYKIKKIDDSNVEVIFEIEEKHEGDIYLGYFYNDYYKIVGKSVLDYNNILNGYGKFKLKSLIGKYRGLKLNLLLRKIFRTNLNCMFNLNYIESDEKKYFNESDYFEYVEKTFNGKITLGYNIFKNALLEFGLNRQKSKYLDLNFYTSEFSTGFIFDNLDKAIIPKNGMILNMLYLKSLDENSFVKKNIVLDFYKTYSRFTIISDFDYCLADGNVPLIEKYRLGGPDFFPGYNINQFRVNNYYSGVLGVRYLIRKYTTLVKRELYFSIKGSMINMSDNENFKNDNEHITTGINFNLILDTVIGAVKLTYGISEHDRKMFYLNINEIKF